MNYSFPILEFQNSQANSMFYIPFPFLFHIFYSLKYWKMRELEWHKPFTHCTMALEWLDLCHNAILLTAAETFLQVV
jgi:hypothetical protein